MQAFVLDACSLIAFLNDEEGADKVEDLLRKAKEERVKLYINKVNLLEIYYGIYRDDGEEAANETLSTILGLPILVVDKLSDGVLRESGRLKASYNISLAVRMTVKLWHMLVEFQDTLGSTCQSSDFYLITTPIPLPQSELKEFMHKPDRICAKRK